MSISQVTLGHQLARGPDQFFIERNRSVQDERCFEKMLSRIKNLMAIFSEIGQCGVDLAVRAVRKSFDEGSRQLMRALGHNCLLNRVVERVFGRKIHQRS